MNIQIIGTNKSSDTRKALRYFAERRVAVHFRDLSEKALAKGELDNITARLPIEMLLDTESRSYKRRNLRYMRFNIEEELLADWELVKAPIARYGTNITLGYEPDTWKEWIDAEKNK
jgi:arsenate reductase